VARNFLALQNKIAGIIDRPKNRDELAEHNLTAKINCDEKTEHEEKADAGTSPMAAGSFGRSSFELWSPRNVQQTHFTQSGGTGNVQVAIPSN